MASTNKTFFAVRTGLPQIIFSVLIWGTIPFLIQFTSKEIPAAELIAIRLIIAGMIMVFWVGPARFIKAVRSSLGLFLILAILGLTIPQILYIYALKLLPISVVTFITNSYPAFAIALAVLILKEKPTVRHIIGIGSALVGLYLLAGVALKNGEGAAIGVLLAFLASLGWGASAIAGKKITERLNPSEIVAGRHFLGGIFALPLMMFEGVAVRNISIWAWVGAVVLALMSVISFYSYYKGLAKISVSTASVIESFSPVVTLLISILFLREAVDGGRLVGAACVLLGTVLVSLGESRKTEPVISPVGD